MKANRLIAILVVIVLIAGVYLFFPGNREGTSDQASAEVSNVQEKEEPEVPEGWNGYENYQYNFRLFYPGTLNVSEFNEGEGALTVVFQDTDVVSGFQIFIVPYNEEKISDDRFFKDNPSGVREGSTNLSVDGVQGVAFYSQHALLGETREVWFIHNGYLFELTTLRPMESLLMEVLRTWEFNLNTSS